MRRMDGDWIGEKKIKIIFNVEVYFLDVVSKNKY